MNKIIIIDMKKGLIVSQLLLYAELKYSYWTVRDPSNSDPFLFGHFFRVAIQTIMTWLILYIFVIQ